MTDEPPGSLFAGGVFGEGIPAADRPRLEKPKAEDPALTEYRSPARGDRVRSGCAGIVLFFPFYLLLVIVVLPIRGLIVGPGADFAATIPGAVILYFALLSAPLAVVYGQSAGQMIGFGSAWPNIYQARRDRDGVARAGPLRALVHVLAFAVLFPVDWLPWLFGRSRLLHELVAGTEVLVDRRPGQSRLTAGAWLTFLGAAYFVWTLLIMAAGWGDVATYVTVLVMWAVPVGFAIWFLTAERHPLFLSWSIVVVCFVVPPLVLWAVLSGRMPLSPYHTAKLWVLAVEVMGFGIVVLFHAVKRDDWGRLNLSSWIR